MSGNDLWERPELFDRASAWGVTALADLSPKIQNQ